jgi:hypothetical protein
MTLNLWCLIKQYSHFQTQGRALPYNLKILKIKKKSKIKAVLVVCHILELKEVLCWTQLDIQKTTFETSG